jgi:hypothetical protein
MNPLASSYDIDVALLFSNLPQIMDVSLKILQELEGIPNGRSQQTVGNLFLANVKMV